MRTIRAVLVDVDGTLVDTNDAHAQAWVDAFRENGLAVSFERVRPLIGMGADQLLPRVVGINKKSEQGKKLSETWSRIFEERYLPQVISLPGARELLEALHQRGLKLIAASSGEEQISQALLDRVGVASLLADKTTSEDAERSKPAPDIIAAAQQKSGFPADQVVMLGDTPYDIEAARPLGIAVIALRSGGFSDASLAGAAAIYDDPADLLAHLDDAPLLSKK